jgi:hypothetical protein
MAKRTSRQGEKADSGDLIASGAVTVPRPFVCGTREGEIRPSAARLPSSASTGSAWKGNNLAPLWAAVASAPPWSSTPTPFVALLGLPGVLPLLGLPLLFAPRARVRRVAPQSSALALRLRWLKVLLPVGAVVVLAGAGGTGLSGQPFMSQTSHSAIRSCSSWLTLSAGTGWVIALRWRGGGEDR